MTTFWSSRIPIAQFNAEAKPGDHYLVTRGLDSSSRQMISLSGLRGERGDEIVIDARGQVTLDGSFTAIPIRIRDCRHVIVRDFDVCNSKGSVVDITDSSHVTIHRVVATNAAEGNYGIFGTHSTEHTVFQDCVGFGRARKIFSCSQEGNYTKFNRCFARWERSLTTGPKMCYTVAYNSHEAKLDCCVGTLDARMPSTYTLRHNDGIIPYLKWGVETLMQNHEVQAMYGVFSMDQIRDDRRANVTLRNCFAYTGIDSCFPPAIAGFFMNKMHAIRVVECISDMGDGVTKPFSLGDSKNPKEDCVAEKLLGIGVNSYISPSWGGIGYGKVTENVGALDILEAVWKESPMLDRIRIFTGEDVLVNIRATREAATNEFE